MQDYNVLQPTSLISRDRATINNNFESVASNFSGNFFPTQNLVDKMFCYRTDLQKMYQYNQAGQQWMLVYDLSNGNCHVAEATSAQKATNDGNGNNIANTYLKNDNILSKIMSVIYPVGSIYITATNTNPGTFLGGTWQQIASGRTLIGAGGSYNAGATGGSETEVYTPVGSISETVLNINQIPVHNHTASVSSAGTHSHSYVTPRRPGGDTRDEGKYGNTWAINDVVNYETNVTGDHKHIVTIGNTGGGQGHNHSYTGSSKTLSHMQPYLVVFYWQRVG